LSSASASKSSPPSTSAPDRVDECARIRVAAGARSCRSPPPARPGSRIRSPPPVLSRAAAGIPIPVHAHSASSVLPGRCSPPPRSFSTRPVAKFSLCYVLPVSRSHPHCLVFTCSASVFFSSPPVTAAFLPLEVRPRNLAAISVRAGVPRSQKSAGQHSSPTVQEKRSKSKSFETEP
jgi:hypothetical protein